VNATVDTLLTIQQKDIVFVN